MNNMKKCFLFALVGSLTVCTAAVIFATSASRGGLFVQAEEPTYGLNLNASNRVTEVTDGSATKTLKTLLNNDVVFNYTGASVVEGKHVGLSNGGTIVTKDALTGSKSVTAVFTGSIDVYGSGDGVVFSKLDELTSGVKLTYDKTWDYLKFVATSASEVESMELKHTCTTRFTGAEADNKIYAFDSATNIGPLGETGNRGWGSKFWAAMNFADGQGGRFHFYSELGGQHVINWEVNSQGGCHLLVFLNGVQQENLTLPATGHWYNDEQPVGTEVSVTYNLQQGWNELYYMNDPQERASGGYAQVGAITVKALADRKYDPSELDTSIHSLHFEAEQGYYVGKDGGNRFYGASYSGTELLGAIEADGCGTGVTFCLPSQGAGQYDLTARIGCENNTNIKVFVDDFVNEWANDCETTNYLIESESASSSWNVMKTTASVRVTLHEGWNRIRVEFANAWFTLDSFNLVKVVA